MKKRAMGAVLAAGAAVVVVGNMPAANADTQTLLDDMRANGFFSDDGDHAGVILQDAQTVCADLNYKDGEQVANELYWATNLKSLGDARRFVVIAVEDLCPWHDHRPGHQPGVSV